MKNRADISAGSLDMLLDTLCNTFGGVCFIALMVAILSAMLPKASSDDAAKESSVTEEMLAVQERERLTRRRDELTAAVAAFAVSDASDAADLSATGLSAKFSSKRAAVAQLKSERGRLEKTLSDAKSGNPKIKALELRNAELERKVKGFSGKLRKVRTPVEREMPGLRSVTVWLHGGMLYRIGDNRQVKGNALLGGGVCYSMIRGAGSWVDAEFLDGSEWRGIIGDAGARGYVRIYSDLQSFPQLCRLRDSLVASGQMYNWHLHEDDEIVFVSGYDGRVQ